MKRIIIIVVILAVLLPSVAAQESCIEAETFTVCYPENWIADVADDQTVTISTANDIEIFSIPPGELVIILTDLSVDPDVHFQSLENQDFLVGFMSGFLVGIGAVVAAQEQDSTDIGIETPENGMVIVHDNVQSSFVTVLPLEDTAIVVIAAAPAGELEQWMPDIRLVIKSISLSKTRSRPLNSFMGM